MNSLFGFGGIFNSAVTAKQGYNSVKRNTVKNNNSIVNKTAKGKMNFGMFRSPALRGMTRKAKRTVNNKKTNNVYVPSTTEMPELNMSYVKNRNASVKNRFNLMTVGVNLTNANKPKLTNKQFEARRTVARKMALGEPVSYMEKVMAGIIKVPKPTMPRPVKGGKRTRRCNW